MGVRIVLKPQLKRRHPFGAIKSYVQELVVHLGPVIGALVFDVASFEACGSGGMDFMASLVGKVQKRVPVLLDLDQAGSSAERMLKAFPGTGVFNSALSQLEEIERLVQIARKTRGAVFVRLRQGRRILPWIEHTNFGHMALSGWRLHRIAAIAALYREGSWSRLGVTFSQCYERDLIQISALLPFCPIVLPNISAGSMIYKDGVIAVPNDARLKVRTQKDIERALQFGTSIAFKRRIALAHQSSLVGNRE